LLKSCARMRSRTTVSLAILGEPSSIGDALLPRPQRCSHSATRGAFRRAAPLHPWPTREVCLGNLSTNSGRTPKLCPQPGVPAHSRIHAHARTALTFNSQRSRHPAQRYHAFAECPMLL
jgi:hypothetical protein